jgi:pimeloyl-ACP methyl ester carboxylesterase
VATHFHFSQAGVKNGTERRFSMPTVTSKDGTKIAYDKAGQGLVVILVEGAMGSRQASAELAKLLEPDFTVYSFDRRGRGESTDTKPYAVQREVEDIEALIESAGEAVCLYGDD